MGADDTVFALRDIAAAASSRPRLRQAVCSFRGPVLVALAYLLGAEAAFAIGTLSDKIFALFWPPNVILFCALLVVPRREWWRYIVAAFPAHVIAELGVGMPAPQLLVAFATNCAVALVNAYAVRRWVGPPPWFQNSRKASIYIVLAAGIGPALAALGGAFVPILGGGSAQDYWFFWSLWYLANALPNLTVGPVFMIWFSEGLRRLDSFYSRRTLECVALGLALVAACVFSVPLSINVSPSLILPVRLLPLPIVLWAAVRFGEKGASGAILIVSIVLTWNTLRGSGMLAPLGPERSVLTLQLFLIGLAIPLLFLGALVDELRQAERDMRALALSLLRVQDAERRRIARDLHDSTGQNLAAAILIADRLRRSLPAALHGASRQLDELLRASIREVRAVSYLLYPPLLDEAGLEIALRTFVGGYVERTGIAVDLDIAKDFHRLSPETELVLFRVAQEALGNVARHSNSPTARIRLGLTRALSGRKVVLVIEDAGRGIPQLHGVDSRFYRATLPTSEAGVGLVGMRERLYQVGGRLKIASDVGRTVVTAVVPVPEERARPAVNDTVPA